jgi:hypothetical protein
MFVLNAIRRSRTNNDNADDEGAFYFHAAVKTDNHKSDGRKRLYDFTSGSQEETGATLTKAATTRTFVNRRRSKSNVTQRYEPAVELW